MSRSACSRLAPTVAALLLAASILGLASAGPALQPVAPRVGPFLESAITDAETGRSRIWVLWETLPDAVPVAEVQHGLAPGALDLRATGTRTLNEGGYHFHEVELTDLDPATIYHYRVRVAGEEFGETLSFRTPPLPDSEEAFTFVATSDEQPGAGNPTYDRIIARRIVERDIIPAVCGRAEDCPGRLALALSAGDNTATGGNFGEFAPWFESRQALQGRVASIVAIGNHDYFGDGDASHWRGYHHFPENAGLAAFGRPEHPDFDPSFHERWYVQDYGNVRFVVLDSNGFGGGSSTNTTAIQEAWFEAVLEDACERDELDFLLMMMHHNHRFDEIWPVGFAPATGQSMARLEAFATRCGKPTVHVYGHAHDHNRGHDPEHNHVYMNVAGGGGSIDAAPMYDFAQDFDDVLISDASYGFLRADVTAADSPSIRFRRYSSGLRPTADSPGQGVIDDFTITRGGEGPDAPLSFQSRLPGGYELATQFYRDPHGIPQQSSHWQVTRIAGDYSAPVLDVQRHFKNVYRGVDLQAGDDLSAYRFLGAEPGASYAWRVRHRNQHNHWGPWSEELEFTVAEVAEPSIQTARRLQSSGERVMVEWAGLPGNARDLVAVAPVGWPEDQLYEDHFHFTGGAKGGVQAFDRLPSGDYEARAYVDWQDSGSPVRARSAFRMVGADVAVSAEKAAYGAGEPITIRWRGLPGNLRDWVSVTSLEQPVGTRIDGAWTHTNGNYAGHLIVPAPDFGGSYVARAFADDAMTPLAAMTFTVEGPPAPTLTPEPTATPVGPGRPLPLREGFDGLADRLQPAADEAIDPGLLGWTHEPPAGWHVTNARDMPQGTTEWQGWSFTTPAFWSAAEDQSRSSFTLGTGVIAVADPDEWDDHGIGADGGRFDSVLSAPPLAVVGLGSVHLAFGSHYRQEGAQTAVVQLRFDGGEPVEVLRYDGAAGSDNAGGDVLDRREEIEAQVPAGADVMVAEWRLYDAGNNWYWALDDIGIVAGMPASGPSPTAVAGATPTPGDRSVTARLLLPALLHQTR